MTFNSTFDDGSVRIDASLLSKQVSEKEIESALPDVDKAAQLLHSRKGPGNEFLGWLEPEGMITDDEAVPSEESRGESQGEDRQSCGNRDRRIVSRHQSLLRGAQKAGAEHVLLYAGTNLSPRYHHDLLATVAELNFGDQCRFKVRHDNRARDRIQTIQGCARKPGRTRRMPGNLLSRPPTGKGALTELADSEDWETFVVPDNIGGRYSVLTPVGLFPLAYAGIDVDALVGGATECALACRDERLARNPAKLYSAVRHLLWKKGLSVEILATFEPRLEMLIEWWKQLFGESQGKEGQGIFPAGVVFTRDLHSLGQWIQDGSADRVRNFP